MRSYTVNQLAGLAGVSVRTLHHYDQIGLLKPQARTDAGYRLYGERELLRLQQILFYKELDFPLDEVRKVLDSPRFNHSRALQSHRKLLQQRIKRLYCLIQTIDSTIENLCKEKKMLTDRDLYEGFSEEKINEYKKEAREMFNPEIVEKTERKVKRMSKARWNEVRAEGDAVSRRLAGLMDKDPSEKEVQEAIASHHAWIENFYEAPSDLYRGLGQLYVTHKDFRATYDKYREGLADFIRRGIDYYCDHTLKA